MPKSQEMSMVRIKVKPLPMGRPSISMSSAETVAVTMPKGTWGAFSPLNTSPYA